MPKQDHLVCFLAGLLMHGASGPTARDWRTGVGLLDTCVDTYASSKTGLGAEIVFFPIPGQKPEDHRDWRIDKRTPANPHPLDGRYILRPETVESIFFAYRLTGDERYRFVDRLQAELMRPVSKPGPSSRRSSGTVGCRAAATPAFATSTSCRLCTRTDKRRSSSARR